MKPYAFMSYVLDLDLISHLHIDEDPHSVWLEIYFLMGAPSIQVDKSDYRLRSADDAEKAKNLLEGFRQEVHKLRQAWESCGRDLKVIQPTAAVADPLPAPEPPRPRHPRKWEVGMRVRYLRSQEWSWGAGTEATIVELSPEYKDRAGHEYQVFLTEPDSKDATWWTTPDDVELVYK